MIVYLVSTGSYSDWDIHGIYSTREIAEQVRQRLIDLGEYEVNDVDEYAIDSARLDLRQRFSAESIPSSVEVGCCRWLRYGKGPTGVVKERKLAHWRTCDVVGSCLEVDVEAESQEHATKIAADKFREYAALTGWPGNLAT